MESDVVGRPLSFEAGSTPLDKLPDTYRLYLGEVSLKYGEDQITNEQHVAWIKTMRDPLQPPEAAVNARKQLEESVMYLIAWSIKNSSPAMIPREELVGECYDISDW
jgi:hypothetical protein